MYPPREIAPLKASQKILTTTRFNTKLGPMIVIADDDGLYLLEFIDCRGLEREIESLRKKVKAVINPGETLITRNIKSEITRYLEGKSRVFETPIHLLGSSFQKNVWAKLREIPLGETRSYAQVAKSLSKPTAFRAVAQANGANPLAIVVPCHRVINANGQLGGYAGGVARKEWLLKHEKSLTY